MCSKLSKFTLMWRILICSCLALSFVSCKKEELQSIGVDSLEVVDNSNTNVKRVYSVRVQNLDQVGYDHYVMLKPYNQGMPFDFIKKAGFYLDTCKSETPIWTITFCTSFVFDPTDVSQDIRKLEKHRILTISYDWKIKTDSLRRIRSISFGYGDDAVEVPMPR